MCEVRGSLSRSGASTAGHPALVPGWTVGLYKVWVTGHYEWVWWVGGRWVYIRCGLQVIMSGYGGWVDGGSI